MGKGGTSFRVLAVWAGILCSVSVAGCRTSAGVDDLRSMLHVEDGLEPDSLVVGHRFGSWLEVRPTADDRDALELACLLEQVGDREEAIEILSDAIGDEDCAALFEARGALYLSTGYPRAAAGDFQRAVALQADSARCWYALGHAYEVLGLMRQALESLIHAHNLGCADQGLLLSLARVHRALGQSGLAARHYGEALACTDEPALDLMLEATTLTIEAPERAHGVENLRDRIEACLGVQHSEEAWLLRAVLREMPGRSWEDVAAAVRALEASREDITELTNWSLIALQLLDDETREQARKELFAGLADELRREALGRCLELHSLARREHVELAR